MTTSDASWESTAASKPFVALLPIMAAVFVAYLVIGVAMPVLPLHVHDGLGLGTFVVGLVAGSQFTASLISRMWAGNHADSKGAKPAIVIGLLLATAAGGLYLLSLRFATPRTSVAVLLAGRALLGVAESFIITGALSWGLSLLGPQNTGKVMAWIGTGLYAAFAVGAPAGTALYAAHGFGGIALATVLLPLATLLFVVPLRRPAVAASPVRPSFTSVVSAVWQPGLGLALSGVGFGAITTFIALLFASRGWNPAWPAFTALSVAFIVGRLVFGHLPDRIGGAKIALICVLIESVGQALIWRAPGAAVALVGVSLTGLGYSLVYPGFGVEALRRAPAQSRGLAMGAYTAFLDLSLGLASPALGLIAGKAGLASVFLISTFVVLSSAAIAMWILIDMASLKGSV